MAKLWQYYLKNCVTLMHYAIIIESYLFKKYLGGEVMEDKLVYIADDEVKIQEIMKMFLEKDLVPLMFRRLRI